MHSKTLCADGLRMWQVYPVTENADAHAHTQLVGVAKNDTHFIDA